jgi:hypothetical protein
LQAGTTSRRSGFSPEQPSTVHPLTGEMMKKFCVSILLGAALSSFAFGQEKASDSERELSEATKAGREEIRTQKQAFLVNAARPTAGPSDFADLDSFGKNVLFLGSLYAGTVYFDPDCTVNSVGTLAADDKCIIKAPDANLPSQVYTDNAWQVTISGKTVKNVIYLLLNNTVQEFSSNNGPANGTAGLSYSPQVTLVSSALNDPQAIDPATNLPMNGTFTTGLPGSKTSLYSLAPAQFRDDVLSYGSVNGRGFSRAYFRALGLSEAIIDNIFKKDLTLKFAIRAGARPKTEFAAMFYQFRILGQ